MSANVDPIAVGGYWADRVEHLLNGCLRDRDLLPDSQVVDVRFEDFMADDVGTVRRIYEVAGHPFTAATQRAMDEFMSTHQRGRHGGVIYDLADFEIDPNERRSALAGYSQRFGV